MNRAIIAALALTLSVPALADSAADREALKSALDELFAKTALSHGRVALHVIKIDDGSVIFSRNANDLLNPASNVKLFTTATALYHLGPDWRFDTEFLVDAHPGKIANPAGNVSGNLYVLGKGDPSISLERLWEMVNNLWYAGLRSVNGDLVLDDTYFDERYVGPGFDQEHSDRAYMAPTGALSLAGNTVAVHIAPGDSVNSPARVELEPDNNFFVLENHAVTSRQKSYRRLFVSSTSLGERQKIVVSGRIPFNQTPVLAFKKIDQPTFYFGNTLKALLAQRGIKVKGKIKRAAVPRDAVSLLVQQSDTLDLVLKKVNKNSSNFMAEQLIKTLGAQKSGAAGSWESGISSVEDFLANNVGIPLGSYIMKNGSGLNDTNRFSAAQICRLLRYMALHFSLAPEYLSSLGIAGKDGTVHSRMEGTNAVGRLRAKTGTLENVSALSGYIDAMGGDRLIFSLIASDFAKPTSQVINSIDAVGATLTGFGQIGGPAAAVAQILDGHRARAPIDELKARIASYDMLAKHGDRRNVVFLRTALQSEKDPALRLVIADAAYRSDPNDWANARALVDNFDAGPDVFGRLRKMSLEQGIATPGLLSLIMVASEGNADALNRLVDLAALTKNDQVLELELLEPFSEIARNAPDELISTLHAARESAAMATVDLLAKSLALVAEHDHPFPAILKRSESSNDRQLAVFAKKLDKNLSARMAAELLKAGSSHQ